MSRQGSFSTPGGQRTAPYSTQRGQPAVPSAYKQQPGRGVGSSNGAFASPRSLARDKWARIFGGPTYLEGGSLSNRIVLALRSQIPSEVDWSLDRLILVSFSDVELLRVAEFPGLVEGLFGLVQAFLDARAGERNEGEGRLHGLWVDEAREMVRRRATEAATVLRNLSTDKVNFKAFAGYKKLAPIVTDVLEEGAREGVDGEETAELRVYLLEVLEIVGQHIPLVLPGRSLSQELPATPEDPSSPSVRLFPLLVALTRSPDRALVLAAFRCLTNLSLNELSDAALAAITYPPTSPYPHPIQTAIELLPLADAEISTVALDFIYQHTLLPANSALFCARPELVHILRLICTKLHLGAAKEMLEVTIPMPGGEGATWMATRPARHRRRGTVEPTKAPGPKVDPDDLPALLSLAEPARALTWMRYAFEANPDGEITQVALWTAYRTEFEALSQTDNALLPAADVIKMSTEAFPQALPMVMEGTERKFIIKGIRVRDRTNMKTVFVCRWGPCYDPVGPDSAASLYWHLHHTHLAVDDPPSLCLWGGCTYSSSETDPLLRTNDLSLHIRTHMPTYHPPPGYGDPPTPVEDPNFPVPDLAYTMRHERYHAQLDEASEVTGLGYLSCLVLRNVARTVKVAMGNPAGGASVELLTGGEESIFEALTAAHEGGAKKDAVMMQLEKPDLTGAKKGAEALVGLEEKLVSTTLEDFGLGKLLGEVLAVVTACGTVVRRAEAVEA